MLDGVTNNLDEQREDDDLAAHHYSMAFINKRRQLNEWETDNIPPASKRQVGGMHYASLDIQPSEFIFKNKLNWLEGNAIKYICRHNSKGGRKDIDKAIHYLELLKEWSYDQKEKEQEVPDPAF